MVAVVPVATAEVATCPPVRVRVFAESNLLTGEPAAPVTLTAADVKTVVRLPPLCGVLEGICIGGLTSVTVGTLFTDGWDELTAFCALVGEVRIIVLGATDETGALPLLTVTGPLLTSVTAGCELLPVLSADEVSGIWQFITTALPFKVWTPVVPGFPTPDVPSDTTVTAPLAVPGLDWLWAAAMLGPAADVVPAAPSMLEPWDPALLMTPPCTPVPTAAETHENMGGVEQLSDSL